MADVLEQFYLTLKKNPNIKGLPGDYKSFQEGLSDPENSKSFFETIKSNPNIKGLPNTYDEFADGLGLKKKDLSTSGSQSGFAPFQNIKPGTAPLITQDKLQSQQYTPMPAEMRYKAPKEKAKVGYGKQVLSALESGANTFNANLAATPGFIYDVAGAPFRVMGLDVPKSKDLSKETVAGKGAAIINSYIENQIGNAEKLKQDSQINPEIQKGIVENIKNGNYANAFKSAGLGVAESLPAMIGMGLTGGMGAGGQVATQTRMALPFMSSRWRELADDPTMSEPAKIVNAIVNGYSETIFEDKFGSLGLINQAKKILADQGKEAAEDFVKKGFKESAEAAAKKYFPLTAPISNALEEGATQYAQNFNDLVTGKSPNKDLLEGVSEAMAQGGAFGLGIGAVTGGAKYLQKPLLKEAVASNQPQVVDVIKTKLDEQLNNGEITQEDYDATTEYIANTEAINTKIPASIPAEQRSKMIDITADRNIIMAEQAQLEQELQNTDSAFKPRIQAKIEALQAQVDAHNDAILGIESPVVYRQTEKGYEKDIDGRVEPITQEQFDYADANNLEGIEIEGKVSAPVAEPSAPVEEISTPLNTEQDATTETQKSIEAGSAEGSVEQYQGAQAEQDQTPTETDSGDSIVSSQEAEPQKVIAEAVSLYDDIMNAEGGAKKRSLSDKRRALLDANPRVKHIFENLNKIQEALGERITKEGNCP